MKRNWYTFIIICCLLITFSACQSEEELGSNAIGYLRLGLEVNTSSITRAEAAYNPKQLAVQIVNASGEVVKETTNFETNWKGETIELPVGTYTVKASSAGFDGATSGFDKPYYAGSTQVTVKSEKSANATIECTLANVKVTVNFDQTFKDAFTGAEVEIDDKAGDAGISPLDFIMNQTTQSGYFPVTDLKATVSATNKNSVTNTQVNEITDVKARDHYILNYKVGETTGGNVTVEVDPATKTYTFNIEFPLVVPDQPTLAVSSANAWAKLVYLEGTMNGNNVVEVDPTKVAFQYREKKADATDEDWIKVAAVNENGTYKATITQLPPATAYESRLVYGEENTFTSDVKEFTTEAATALYNGSFEDWNKGTGNYKNTWFADAAVSADFNKSFWDSGNVGTSTGMAATLGAKNPTSPEETIVHTSGKSAKLASTYVVIQFAAGNIYTGNYQETIMNPMGARINFGQPFTARPIALHGWIQYAPGEVNRGKDTNLPSDATLHLGDTDQNAIYIALSDKGAPYEVNNGKKQFIDFDNDPNIIAYGELPQAECVATDGWKEVNIPLVYRSLERKPTHIIIVMSASKYGDYFVGSDSSVMYVDDFELVYDGEPSVQE
ncbi:hypothetical protein Bacsa_1783 [Phocaeicola salanitronis DSM 18170]|uniref:Putative carbohydrate metabolism domain-containing protein n=1 Tax=Phocaeicola salanitronis (strain DSM 18170 / JCM 13657 / CCUG 60908 / BL78) TaxID=667015 RepID=F0R1B4_PHOSB|nr:hypothetical protein Bacsa_1783 [Phocaeicola salanitronis DSM 18170]